MKERKNDASHISKLHSRDVKKFLGNKKANLIKRKIIEGEAHKKAARLRKYAKLCKAEGIQSDRVNMNSAAKVQSSSSQPTNPNGKRKVSKNSLQVRAISVAAKAEAERAEKQQQQEERQHEKEEALKRRAEQRKLLSKTNKKGQPALGNRMKAMLTKIQQKQP